MYTKESFASAKHVALKKLAEQLNEATALYAALEKITHLIPGPAAGQPGYTTDDHLIRAIYRHDYAGALMFLYTRGRSDG